MTFHYSRRILLSLAVSTLAMQSALASSDTCDRDDGVSWGTLRATRKYHPAEWQDDARTLARPTWFFVPLVAPVLTGQSGPHLATLSWRDAQGAIGVCAYLGTGIHLKTTTCTGNGDEYRFTICTLADSSGIRFFGSDELIQAATSIRLHIWNGDSCAPTTAGLNLTSPPDQDENGTPDCLETPRDVSAPTWPVDTSLAAETSGPNVSLTWTAAVDDLGVTGYRIYQDGQLIQTVDASTLLAQVVGVPPNVPLSFQVQAFDAAGNASTDGPTATAFIDTIGPSWPPGAIVSITPQGLSSAIVSWPPASDALGVVAYRLFQDDTLISSNIGLSTNVDNLDPSRTYTFRVKAVDASGNESVDGLQATLRIDADAPVWPAGSTLTASALGTGATFVWTGATDNVGIAGYRLFQDGQLVAETDAGTLSAEVAGLAPNVAHGFQVQAFDQAGNTSSDGPVATVRIDTLAPNWPAGAVLAATRQGNSAVMLSWPAASDEVAVTGYRVFENGQPVVDLNATTLITTISGLDPMTTYAFRVEAFDAAGNTSIDGPRVEVGPSGGAPTWPFGSFFVAVPNGTTGRVDLFWTPAEDDLGVTGYAIFQDGLPLTEVSGMALSTTASGVGLGSHHFEIQAFDATGNRSLPLAVDTELEVNPPTWPPGSAVVAGPSGFLNVVTLAWTPAIDDVAVAKYRVLRNGGVVAESTELSTLAAVFNIAVATFEIEAVDANGNVSVNGPKVTITIDRIAPVWPAGTLLVASASAPGVTTLDWSAATDASGILYYTVYQNGSEIARLDGATQTFDVTGLSSTLDYTFRIKAQDAWGNVSTGDPTVVLRADNGAPTWPAGSVLSVTQAGQEGAILVWTPAFDDVAVTRYRILRDGAPITDVSGSVMFAQLGGLGAQSSYAFQVLALDARGNVAEGPVGSLTFDRNVPTWPPGSTLTASVTATTATLAWTQALDDVGVDRYLVFLNGVPVRTVMAPALSTELLGLFADSNYLLKVEAVDGVGNRTTAGPSAQVRTAPAGPPLVAPPLDPTVATTTYQSTVFLYTGDNPVQRGVLPGTITRERGALVRGQVRNRDGQPISDVTVSVLRHPEYGNTETRSDGRFSLVVNGGEPLTVVYVHAQYLAAHRHIDPVWKDTVQAPDVVLVRPDPELTEVTSDATASQVVRGSVQEDQDGPRQATLIFPSETLASMTLPDGTVTALPTLHVRATEYTVGPTGPQAMPAPLPPASAYTYAVELSADEALEMGATRVTFDKPIPLYVENFLGFQVGESVPLGYYDFDTGGWVAADSGRVVEIVGVFLGLARLDTDGDGAPDSESSLAQLGITPEERAELAGLYPVGTSLWRVAISHFTPFDINWATIPPTDVQAPRVTPGRVGTHDEHPCRRPGSIVSCQTRALGERISISGTGVALHYDGTRVAGRSAELHLRIPLTGASVSPSLMRVHLEVDVAGQHHEFDYAPLANQTSDFAWNGKDGFGRTVQGPTNARVTLSYDYPIEYGSTDRFGRLAITGTGISRSNGVTRLSSEASVALGGFHNTPGNSMGGWAPTGLAAADPATGIVYHPDGRVEHTAPARAKLLGVGGDFGMFFVNEIVPDGKGGIYFGGRVAANIVLHMTREGNTEIVAGTQHVWGFSGDGGPATEALLCDVMGLALGPDGSLYILDTGLDTPNIPSCRPGGRVRRVAPDGLISTIAGTGANVSSGDNGPAIAAGIAYASGGLVMGTDGALYFGTTNYGIRRIGTDGMISKYAPVHVPFNGGSAGASWLAAARDGSIYYLDAGRGDIWRITPQGENVQVAGNGTRATQSAPSGGGALETSIAPWALALGPDGTVFFGEFIEYPTGPRLGGRVRKIDREGKIVDVADGACAYGGRGSEAPALTATGRACGSTALAVGWDGTFYFGGANLLASAQLLDGTDWASGTLLSTDGARQYVFDQDGRHLRTQDPLTGVSRLSFGYDSFGRLTSLVDADNNTVSIAYSSPDRMIVTPPMGGVTALSLNSDGYVTSITNPAGETIGMTYADGGLLTSLSDPFSGTSTFTYDSEGLLQRDTSAGGGYQELVNSTPDGSVVTRTTRMGRNSRYETTSLPDGSERRRVTGPDGLTTEMVEDFDHTKTLAYPDGSRLQLTQAPDPLLGVRALNTTKAVFTTPVGRSLQADTSVTYQGGAPGDPASIGSMTVQSTVNGVPTGTQVYDAASRTITTTSAAGRRTQTVVDERGRTSTVAVPGVLPITYAYDSLGRTKSVTQGQRQFVLDYDSAGNVSAVTAPGNEQTQSTYDALGRPLIVTRPDGMVLTFAYEQSGRRSIVTPPGKPAHVGEVNPEAQTSLYAPPSIAGAGSQRMSQLDDDGLLSTATYGQGAAAAVVAVTRDGAGRALTVTSPRGIFTYSYTADGHIDTVSTPEGASTHFTFDGPLLSGTDVSGPVSGQVSYSYDTNLRLNGETVNGSPIAFAYDADNLLLSAGDLGLGRDTASGVVQTAAVHNVGWTFGRNAYGEIDDREALYGDLLFWATHVSSRDAKGRILSRQESIADGVHAFDYAYDILGRLTDVTIDGVPREHYEYDDNGNRLSTTRPVGDAEAQYDFQDRIINHGGSSYTQSADGALTSKVSSGTGATTLYNYDIAGNLLEVSLPSGDVLEYLVDAEGRRIARKLNGEFTNRWVYASNAGPAAEVDSEGRVVTRFVYGTRTWVPTYMTRGGRTYALVADALGSVRFVVDADSGAIVQELVYDTFGVVVRDTSPGFQPFGFGGGLYEPATGLVRLGARDYDADTGRWTTKDPLLFGGGDSNVYAYAGNDPVNGMDPAGLSVGSWLSDLWLGARMSADNILNGREDPLVDSIAGWGDTLSFGLTGRIREDFGLTQFVNPCSDDYHRGSKGAHAYGALMVVASLGASAAVEGAEAAEGISAGKNLTGNTFEAANGGPGAARIGTGGGVPFDPNQAALIELAKQAQRTGVSASDARTLLEWAKEYGVRFRNDIGTTHWVGGDHVHIGPINHIPVF